MKDDSLSTLVIEPVGPPRCTIIWLHGLGADGHDFEGIVAELRLPDTLGVRFVLPHAPHRPVTINGGYVMRAWYDITALEIQKTADEKGICASRHAVMKLIQNEMAAGIPAERILVAGFSQGGVIALETLFHHSDSVAGAIALSCYVALPCNLPVANRPLPIFMGHGAYDEVVPYAVGVASKKQLEEKGYAVEWHKYTLSHSVGYDEITDIRKWIIRVLSKSGSG